MNEAIFFPAFKRSLDQSPQYRCYSLKPSNLLHHDFNDSFPVFQKITDLTLAADYEHKSFATGSEQIILIPTVGSIRVEHAGQSFILEAGQLATLPITQDDSISIANPSDSELINYIEIWLSKEDSLPLTPQIHQLNLDSVNELTTFELTKRFNISIGKFQGRRQGKMNVKGPSTALAYVIHGVFEFQNRLMEAGDGLALYGDFHTIEFEALAQESILFVLLYH